MSHRVTIVLQSPPQPDPLYAAMLEVYSGARQPPHPVVSSGAHEPSTTVPYVRDDGSLCRDLEIPEGQINITLTTPTGICTERL